MNIRPITIAIHIITAGAFSSAYANEPFIPSYEFGSSYHLVPYKDQYRDARFTYTQRKTSQGIRLDPQVESIDNPAFNRNTHWWLIDHDGKVKFTGINANYVLCQGATCEWEAEDVDGKYFRLKDPASGQYLSLQDDMSVTLSSTVDENSNWRLVSATDHSRYKNHSYNLKRNFISTNPSNPNVPSEKRNNLYGTNNDYQTNRFDWTQVNLPLVEYEHGQPIEVGPVVNPGYHHYLGRYPFAADPNNLDTLPDMQPQHGWELIKANLGYHMLIDGETETPFESQPYPMPYIILYNRLSSKLRVLAYYDSSPSIYNSAVIELSHSGTSERVATNLFSPYQSHPVNRSEAPSKVSSMAKIIANEDRQWIYADFEVGYDPCTSCYSSAINVKISPIAEGRIELTGRSTAVSVPVRDSSGMVSDDYLVSYLARDGVDEQVGATTFRSYEALYDQFKDQTDFATAAYSGGNGWSPNSDEAFALNKVSEFLGVAGGVSPEPISKSVLGGLSGLTKFANFSRPSVMEGIELPPPMPTVVFGELALVGSVQFSGNTDSIVIENPGSIRAKDAPEVSSEGSYPTYNEELGVFSLITMPNMYMGKWYDSEEVTISNDGYTCTLIHHWWEDGPCQIRSNLLSGAGVGDILYTINPASGWHPEEIDVFVAVERIQNGKLFRTSQFVPIEKWKTNLRIPLKDDTNIGNNNGYNLKIAVAKAGTIDTSTDGLFNPPQSMAQFLQILTYPIKLMDGSDILPYPYGQLPTETKYDDLSRSFNELKPYYISPSEYKEKFCTTDEYQAKNIEL